MNTALRVLAAAVLMALVSTHLLAQSAGKRPVRVLTPATPGGPGDIQIRLLLPKLSEALGQTLIVDNRASNNGVVAMEIAARSPPDAHTFAVGNTPQEFREVVVRDVEKYRKIIVESDIPRL